MSGSARSKETLEWLSNDIFGKVVQIKKGVTIDRDKTSINLNENMDSLVPASKIFDMATGWICGLPKFYTFPSREERERILYKNFVHVGQDVKEMIKDVLNKRGAK